MNLQLDQLLSVPSKREEQLFDEITDLFIGAQQAAMMIQQQIASAELLCAVYDHVRKYGITEENRDLFAMSFESVGCDYSEENVLANAYHSVKNVIERIIKFLKEKVQVFFKKIKEWYRSIFKKKLQDAPKQPLTKEQEAEFNKRMAASTGSSNEGIADASFTELMQAIDGQSDQGGNRFVYVEDMTKSLELLVRNFKQIVSSVQNNKVFEPIEIGHQRFGTASEGGWADPTKVGKMLDAANTASDAIDDFILDMRRVGDRLMKGDVSLDPKVMEMMKGVDGEMMEVMIVVRFSIRVAKKAMEIRESILKGEVD